MQFGRALIGGRISILMYWVGNFCLLWNCLSPAAFTMGVHRARATKTEALTQPWMGASGIRRTSVASGPVGRGRLRNNDLSPTIRFPNECRRGTSPHSIIRSNVAQFRSFSHCDCGSPRCFCLAPRYPMIAGDSLYGRPSFAK